MTALRDRVPRIARTEEWRIAAYPELRMAEGSSGAAPSFLPPSPAMEREEARAQARELRRIKAAGVVQDLLEQVALERSELAFSELYDRVSPKIYALLLHLLRSDEDALDALQEIFILIWEKAPLFYRADGNATAWIIQLARNRAIDEVRSRRVRKGPLTSYDFSREQPALNELVEDYHTPDGDLAAKENGYEVRRALSALTPQQRTVIDLVYFGGLTHEEVSTQLNIPAGSVSSIMRQSIMKLRKILQPRMGVEFPKREIKQNPKKFVRGAW